MSGTFHCKQRGAAPIPSVYSINFKRKKRTFYAQKPHFFRLVREHLIGGGAPRAEFIINFLRLFVLQVDSCPSALGYCNDKDLSCGRSVIGVEVRGIGEVRPWYHGKYSAFFEGIGKVVSQTQVTELCGKIIRWGRGDDEKRLCQRRLHDYIVSEKQQRAENSSVASACTILSLGCNGQWSFERLAFRNTPCRVHTFDCTGTWPVPEVLRSRVTIHRVCLGTPSMVTMNPSRFANYTGLLQMTGRRAPAFMKVDIEGVSPLNTRFNETICT